MPAAIWLFWDYARRRHWTNMPFPAFPVTIAKDGGADGTPTSPATWTYTLTDMHGEQLGAGVPQSKPRPNGTSQVQTGAPAQGIAYRDESGNVKLWDAGETPAPALEIKYTIDGGSQVTSATIPDGKVIKTISHQITGLQVVIAITTQCYKPQV